MNADLAMQRALDRLDRHGLAALDERERILAAIWWFEAKVANGGFERFYRSPGGDLAALLPDAFRAIGATAHAEIAAAANAVFGSEGVPLDRARREEVLRSLPSAARAQFDALESRYYECATDLEDRLERFLAATAPRAN